MRQRAGLGLYLWHTLKLGQVLAGPKRAQAESLKLVVKLVELISGSDEVGSC
jgi:hypothetical protein